VYGRAVDARHRHRMSGFFLAVALQRVWVRRSRPAIVVPCVWGALRPPEFSVAVRPSPNSYCFAQQLPWAGLSQGLPINALME